MIESPGSMAGVWEQRAVTAAVEAATANGMDGSRARLLRVGENAAVYLPAAGVLAKVAADQRLLDHVRREVAVAHWLSSVEIPVVRPVVDEPVVVSGSVVALWEYLPDAESADLGTLACCLRRLHAVPVPPHPVLPRVQPFARFDDRLASAVSLKEADRVLLTDLRDNLAARWEHVSFELPESVVHGDAHMENLLRTSSGRLAFVDLENVAVGPPEWDLTLTALYYECGWFIAEEYQTFADASGYDVRSSPAWPVLRGIRMLRMTTWLAQTAADYPQRMVQLRHRLTTLRDGTAPSGWTGF